MAETPSRLPVRSRPSAAFEDTNKRTAASPSNAPARKKHALPTKFTSQSTHTTASTTNAVNARNVKPAASLVTAKWDTKSRMEGLEDSINSLTNTLNTKVELADAMTEQVELLKERCDELEVEKEALMRQLKEKEDYCNMATAEEDMKIKELEQSMNELRNKNDGIEQELLKTERKLADALEEDERLRAGVTIDRGANRDT